MAYETINFTNGFSLDITKRFFEVQMQRTEFISSVVLQFPKVDKTYRFFLAYATDKFASASDATYIFASASNSKDYLKIGVGSSTTANENYIEFVATSTGVNKCEILYTNTSGRQRFIGNTIRLYPATSSDGATFEISEIKVVITSLANEFQGQSLTLSDGVTIRTNDTGSDVLQIDSRGLYAWTGAASSTNYTRITSTGLSQYCTLAAGTATSSIVIGKLAEGVYGAWFPRLSIGGNSWDNAPIMTDDSGNITITTTDSTVSGGLFTMINGSGTVSFQCKEGEDTFLVSGAFESDYDAARPQAKFGALYLQSIGGHLAWFSNNAVYAGGGFNYITSNYAHLMEMASTGINFYTAAAGTSGTAITWTKGLNINSSATYLYGVTYIRGYTGGTGVSAIAGYAKNLVIGGAYNSSYNSGNACLLHIADYSNDSENVYPIFVEDENNFIDFCIYNNQQGTTYNGFTYIGSRLGVGTTSPKARFELVDNGYTTSDTLVRISADDASTYALVIANNTAATSSSRGLRFWVDSNGTAEIDNYSTSTAKPLLLNTHGGFVGIGALSPETNLHASGSVTAGGMFRGKGWYDTGSGQAVEVGVTGGTGYVISYNRTSALYCPFTMDTMNTQFNNRNAAGSVLSQIYCSGSTPFDSFIDVKSRGTTTLVRFSDASYFYTGIYPDAGASNRSIGNASYRWNNIYGKYLDISGGATNPLFTLTGTGGVDIHYSGPAGMWQVGTNAAGNGTNNSQFYIYGNAYHLTVQYGTGYVGIGTSAPSYTLHATSSGAVTIYGVNGSTGNGVYGLSYSGIGVTGVASNSSYYGVYGYNAVGIAIYGYSTAAAYGYAATKGYSYYGYGVYGQVANGGGGVTRCAGVYGNGISIYGATGVYGIASNSSYYGVHGSNNAGVGVYAYSAGGWIGALKAVNNTGYAIVASGSIGIFAQGNTQHGIIGYTWGSAYHGVTGVGQVSGSFGVVGIGVNDTSSFSGYFSGGKFGINLVAGSPGTLTVVNMPSTSTAGTVLHCDGSGYVYKYTSSIRYKSNVKPLEFDSARFYSLQPSSYNDPTREYGFIAEHVNTIFPEMVLKNKEGLCESVKYDQIGVWNTAAIHVHEKQINEYALRLIEQENKMKEKDVQLQDLTDKLNELMAIFKELHQNETLALS